MLLQFRNKVGPRLATVDAEDFNAGLRPVLEVADILREHGPAWRETNRGHVSLDQLKVMSAIERCRTVALGGHVARCENAVRSYAHRLQLVP